MLAIGRALMTNPDLLLMDEPSEGLAPIIVKELGRIINEIKRSGFSILLVEQNLPLALEVSDYAYIMNKGLIVFGAPTGQLRDEVDIQAKYLGIRR